jgi:hypothetical protein
LTISSGGINKSVDLNFIVTPLSGDIYTAAELVAIVGNLSGTYTLMNDITLSGNWTHIGSYATAFTGTLDGQGYTISGLTIEDYSATPTSIFGLFGYMNGALVENLGLVNVNIIVPAHIYVGGIAGRGAPGTTIRNCYVTGSITAGSVVGGVVGYIVGGTVENCYSTADIFADTINSYVGGITAQSGTVRNCYASGRITNYSAGSGGIAGPQGGGSALIDNIALSPELTGSSSKRISWSTPTFTNNYARADMKVGGGTVSGSATDKNGADVALGTPLATVFSFGDWGNTAIWTIPPGTLVVGGALPTLTNVPQSPPPTLPAP